MVFWVVARALLCSCWGALDGCFDIAKGLWVVHRAFLHGIATVGGSYGIVKQMLRWLSISFCVVVTIVL